MDNKYIRYFNWKQFFRISCSIFFISFGGTFAAYSKGNLLAMAFGFIMVGIGAALLVVMEDE